MRGKILGLFERIFTSAKQISPVFNRIKFESIEKIIIFQIIREAVKPKRNLKGKDFRESGTVKENILEHLVELKSLKKFQKL